ncbi:uncharacterized protein LOC123261192 isoform X1 [Cotesia glomerata]|nr:uncharacterized protein LOC123261192 isoform X1 [Cotesia glomerata]
MKKIILIFVFVFCALMCIEVESKPVARSIERSNEVGQNYRMSQSKSIESNLAQALSSISKIIQPRNLPENDKNGTNTNIQPVFNEEIASVSNNLLTNFFYPLLSRFQFSPQEFFQDSLGFLKDTITKLSSIFPADTTQARQFTNMNGLANFIGLDDNGFYTDRLEPAGLLGGNGWFANKGGLLGGPGAILSTGPILTDYPTPYKKK